jgi:hypothetical protein
MRFYQFYYYVFGDWATIKTDKVDPTKILPKVQEFERMVPPGSPERAQFYRRGHIHLYDEARMDPRLRGDDRCERG